MRRGCGEDERETDEHEMDDVGMLMKEGACVCRMMD